MKYKAFLSTTTLRAASLFKGGLCNQDRPFLSGFMASSADKFRKLK